MKLLKIIRSKFTSGNDIPVERITITREEASEILYNDKNEYAMSETSETDAFFAEGQRTVSGTREFARALEWQRDEARRDLAEALAAGRTMTEAADRYFATATQLRSLLQDAGSVLDYWRKNHTSVTSERVENELLPAIRAALAAAPPKEPK